MGHPMPLWWPLKECCDLMPISCFSCNGFYSWCHVRMWCSLFGIIGVTDECLEALSRSCSNTITTLDVNGCIGIKVITLSVCVIFVFWIVNYSHLLDWRLWLYAFFPHRDGVVMNCFICSHIWSASKCTANVWSMEICKEPDHLLADKVLCLLSFQIAWSK
jgi:hypothetical protein